MLLMTHFQKQHSSFTNSNYRWTTTNTQTTSRPRQDSKCAGRVVSVLALPGQIIASSSVTLRNRTSRSACKSWNILKLMSYQKAVTGEREGGLFEGVETPARVLGLPGTVPTSLSQHWGILKAPQLWSLPKADPSSDLLLTMNTDHSLED